MAEERTERRLAAIMSGDVAGYSRLMGKDEAGTLSALKALRKDVFAPQVTAHKGRVVKLMGDGALVEFSSVVDAVDCAIAVQRAMADESIKLRIGINLGDIIIEGSDIYGDGVNVAARIQEIAEPGGIALSAVAHDQVAGKVEATFKDSGEHELKNIDKPVRVYRWTAAAADPMPSTPRTEDALPLPDKPSIAVLPFDNMSGDPEQEFFSDGITEDIITELSRFSSLFVIARNSSFIFKGEAVNISEVGSKLGVQYVVEGSVRKAGNRVRITAQLIEAASGNHLWAERYDRDLDDIFAVQDEVVREIATAVPGQLDVAALNMVQRRSDQNFTAYEYVLRGELLRGHDWGSVESLPLFEAAIEADPQCAKAYAHISNWHSYSILAHFAPADEARELTRSLAEKALQIVRNDPYVLALLAEAYMMAGDLDPARKYIEKAIKLNPNHYMVMVYAADVLAWLGDIDEALRWRELCTLHDPLSIAAITEVDLEVFYLAERFDDAINAISGWHNTSIHLLAEFAATYAQAGRIDQAEAMRKQFEERAPDSDTIKNHVDAQQRMCALQKHRDLWLEGYRKAGFDV